ncbi:MAG: response regulator [Gammaproteobacteria bacterium]|nr:response regulator [Gammaproteobacteria bacterium]
MRLLIVDDSNIIRSRIARALRDRSYQTVGLARSGEEALAIFRATLPDAVTMDLTMPGMDGIECIRRLMRLRPDTRILVVSALADKATAIEALKAGARGFLQKPFGEDELRDAMTTLME